MSSWVNKITENSEKSLYSFPKPNVTSTICLFYPTKGPKTKDISK